MAHRIDYWICKLMEKALVGVFCEVVDDGKEVEGNAVRQDGEQGCLFEV